MNSKKDEPSKDPASGPGAGRPHATLDLKATVVKPPEASQPGKDEKAAPPEPGKSGAAAAQPDALARGDARAAKAEAAAKPAGAPGSRSGYGGFFTHLSAGVAGGILALLAADMLAFQLGFQGNADRRDISPAMLQRITALEAATGQKPATPELTSRLAAAEAKLAKLQPLGARIDQLAQRQGELDRSLKEAAAKGTAPGAGPDAEARIGKLEEQLATLSAAAARDPGAGRLPQLAAVTGKIADLEQTMSNQLAALRASVNSEIDARLAAVTEAGETAKSGTQRIDRELAGIKADNAQFATRLNTLNAETDRAGAALKSSQEELGKLKAELDARLASFAKPEDVASAVTPLAGKLSSLHDDVQSVIKSEGERQATAQRIVLSLELANLKRAIDRGKGYAPELAQAKKLAGAGIDLEPLSRFERSGVPTQAELRQDFKAVAFKMIDTVEEPADGSLVDRLLAGARSVVRVRKISHGADDKTVEAVIARMEAALAEDRLADVLAEAQTLPQPVQDAARDFLAKVEARNAADRALATVESQLKDSLVAPAVPVAPAAPAAPAAAPAQQ